MTPHSATFIANRRDRASWHLNAEHIGLDVSTGSAIIMVMGLDRCRGPYATAAQELLRVMSAYDWALQALPQSPMTRYARQTRFNILVNETRWLVALESPSSEAIKQAVLVSKYDNHTQH